MTIELSMTDAIVEIDRMGAIQNACTDETGQIKNKLELLDTAQGWIAIFTGKTCGGEYVLDEEGHNIQGDSDEDRVESALAVWGADITDTLVTIS